MASYATEETLQDLLTEMKSMNEQIGKMTTILGKCCSDNKNTNTNTDSHDNTNQTDRRTTMDRFFNGMGPAGKSLLALASAAGLAATLIGGFLGAIVGVVDRFKDAGEIFLKFLGNVSKGNMKMSELVGVMQDLTAEIPIFGGLLSMLFIPMKLAIQRQEESLEMFRKIASSGAGIGQNLESLRVNARLTGLTLDEYASTVSNSSKIFATMGGDVNAGTKLFNKSMQQVMGSNNEVSRAFFGMGYTAREASDALVTYMQSQGTMNKQGMQDYKKVAQSALEAAQQTQYLAESTGKRREQIEKEIKEAQEEENWQAYLAGLSEKGAKEATEKLKYALAHGGKDAGDMVKTGLMTGVVLPMTDSQRKADALTNGALTKFSTGIINSSGSYEQRMQQMDRANGQFVKGTQRAVDDFRTVNGLLMAQGKGSLINGAIIANATRAHGKSIDQQVQDGIEMRKKIKNAGEGTAAEIASATQQLRQFGAIVDNIMGVLLGPFLEPIMKLSKSFEDSVLVMLEWVKPYLQQFGTWIAKWITIFTDDPPKTWDQFKGKMLGMWEEAKNWMGPKIHELWEWSKPYIKAGFEKVIDFVLDMLREKLGIFGKLLGKKSDEQKKEKVEDLKKKIASADAEIKVNKAGLNSAPDKSWWRSDKADYKRQLDESMKRRAALQKQLDEIQPPETKVNTTNVASLPLKPIQSTNVVHPKVTVNATSKQMVDDYRAHLQQKTANESAALAAKEKAEREKNAKHAQQQKAQQQQNVPLPESGGAQTNTPDYLESINSNMRQLIAFTRETAENTKKTASAMNRNLLRGV